MKITDNESQLSRKKNAMYIYIYIYVKITSNNNTISKLNQIFLKCRDL